MPSKIILLAIELELPPDLPLRGETQESPTALVTKDEDKKV